MMKSLFCGLAGLTLLLCSLPFLIYFWVSWQARPYLFQQLEALPEGRVALVLGTSKYLKRGQINLYYQRRIDAALALYRAGKVKYFIVSGDNRRHDYNEPEWMKNDLIRGGVPAQNIQADYAGLRTLDSVLRAEAIFGQRDYIIISQRFHNQRALFLSHWHGQNTLAFNAEDITARPARWRMFWREVAARCRAVYDLISRKKARHGGEAIVFPPDEHS